MTNMRYALTIIIMSSLSSSWSWFFSSQPVRGLQLFGWGWSHPLYWACQVWLLALASFTSRLFHHHKPSTQQHHRHPRLEQGDHRKCGNTSICDAPTPRRGLCLHQVRTRGLQHTKFTSTICIIVWPGYEERYWESDWMWSKGSFFLVLILIRIILILILLIVVTVTIICSVDNRWWYLKRSGPRIWLFDR